MQDVSSDKGYNEGSLPTIALDSSPFQSGRGMGEFFRCMKFSVVITTYNRLDLLKRAIDSALSQTEACEVVVADDCSSDETQGYVCRLRDALLATGDDRLVYHCNAANSGHSATMNAGVKVAKGDWIKPLDDDDYLAANCIEEMSRAIALRPQAVICSCQAAQVDENEVELSCTPQTGPGKAFYIPQEDIHYGMLLEMVPFGTPVQVAFRRDSFWQAEGWDSCFDGNCDDIDSWIKISQFGDAIFLNQCLAYRTIWSGAYNYKFSLKKRLYANILMKQKIHKLVHPKYHELIPGIDEIRTYLKLHWGFVALKNKNFLSGLKVSFPALFSFKAWKLLLKAILFRQNPWLSKEKFIAEYTEYIFDINQNCSVLNSISSKSKRASVQDMRNYVQLRWSWAAIKQANICRGVRIASKALFYLLTRKVLEIEYGFDKKAPLQEKIEANICLIENIYEAIDKKHRHDLPSLKAMRSYLKLRWSWAAIKQGKLLMGIKVVLPAIFSLPAWVLVFSSLEAKHREKRYNQIRKLVLIEE